MSVNTPDVRMRHTPIGLALALTSAVSFGMSGTLARGLMDAGWTAGAAVSLRVTIAALVLVAPGFLAVRGRIHLVVTHARTIALYGLLAVAGAQLLYFMAVARLDVGVALLIEYTAPVAVVVWMWLAHGQRPGPLTAVGATVAAVGLVLLLDVVGGASVDVIGVLLALGAMVGAATYFVISADETSGLPPLTLAAGGLLVASALFWVTAATGLLPIAMTTADVTFTVGVVPWWVPVLTLGLVTAALAYVTGIGAARRLGSRLASFVALSEVAAALLFAWLLLGQTAGPVQLAGALLILGGVVVVKLGERGVASVGADENLVVEILPVQDPPHRR